MTTTEDYATAIHESAHACAWIELFRWPFQILSIEPKDNMVGWLSGEVPDDPRAPIMWLAGCVAEHRYTGISLDTLFDGVAKEMSNQPRKLWPRITLRGRLLL